MIPLPSLDLLTEAGYADWLEQNRQAALKAAPVRSIHARPGHPKRVRPSQPTKAPE